MNAIFIGLMLAAGICTVLQVAFNARLKTSVDSPILSTMISICVSTIVLAPILICGWFGRGRLDNLQSVPAWAWLGGAAGAFYLVANLVSLPRLGAAMVVACAVAGQLVASVTIDNFGLFDVPKTPVNPFRIAGAILVFLGVVLIQRK